MARQIIKQPNGLYAEFSTVVDGFVVINATREELIEQRLLDARERIEQDIDIILEKIELGKPAYYQFTMTYVEALAEHESRHGSIANFDEE